MQMHRGSFVKSAYPLWVQCVHRMEHLYIWDAEHMQIKLYICCVYYCVHNIVGSVCASDLKVILHTP